MNSKNKTNETWVSIPAESNYLISDLGRVKHIYKNGNDLILTPATNGQTERDYQFVIIEGKKHYVHQLVLKAFVGSRPLEHDCDHIDGNRHNNSLSNLRYLHRSLNRSHKGTAHPSAKLTDVLVRMARFMAGQGVTQKQIAELIGVSPKTISSVITFRTWSHVA